MMSLNTYPGNGGEMTPSAVFVENRIVSKEWDSCFCDLVTSGSDVTSTWLVLRLPALYACDAYTSLHRCDIFWMLETENGETTIYELYFTMKVAIVKHKISSNEK